MKKRYRDIHGKAMKWKDTAFGRRHYARIRFFQRAMLYGVSYSTMAQIELIRSASAKTPEMKTKKALAIADAKIKGQERRSKTIAITNQWLT